MLKSVSYGIKIVAHNDGADLFVDTRQYWLDPEQLVDLDGLKSLLRNEPDHTYNAIIHLLKELSA